MILFLGMKVLYYIFAFHVCLDPRRHEADELLDAGDMDGQAVWKQILAAIEELLSKEALEGAQAYNQTLPRQAIS